MKWIKSSDELPPVNKRLLLGSFSKLNGDFIWFDTVIESPDLSQDSIDPYFYLFSVRMAHDDDYKGILCSDHYWLDLELPENPKTEGC